MVISTKTTVYFNLSSQEEGKKKNKLIEEGDRKGSICKG